MEATEGTAAPHTVVPDDIRIAVCAKRIETDSFPFILRMTADWFEGKPSFFDDVPPINKWLITWTLMRRFNRELQVKVPPPMLA